MYLVSRELSAHRGIGGDSHTTDLSAIYVCYVFVALHLDCVCQLILHQSMLPNSLSLLMAFNRGSAFNRDTITAPPIVSVVTSR